MALLRRESENTENLKIKKRKKKDTEEMFLTLRFITFRSTKEKTQKICKLKKKNTEEMFLTLLCFITDR